MSLDFLSKIKFYLYLLFFKLIVPFECSNYRIAIFIAELSVQMHRNFNSRIYNPNKKQEIILKTKFGNFYIRKIIIDLIIASSSFERQDLMKLTQLISRSIQQGKRVLFIDIGAGFGKYTVSIGMQFKDDKTNFQIWSFEPEKENFLLLQKNIKLNNLKKVKTFQTALSNKVAIKEFYVEPTMHMFASSSSSSKKVKVKTQILDNYIKFMEESFDEVYIKLDVEGHETEVLKGAQKLIDLIDKTILLVEDSFTSKTTAKLENYLKNKGRLMIKQTTYNSFWEMNN